MYSGEGRLAESSSERKVGIDIGGKGRAIGVGETWSRMSRDSRCRSAPLDTSSLCCISNGGGTCLPCLRPSASFVCVCALERDRDVVLCTSAGVVTDRDRGIGRPLRSSVEGVLMTSVSFSWLNSRPLETRSFFESRFVSLNSIGRHGGVQGRSADRSGGWRSVGDY